MEPFHLQRFLDAHLRDFPAALAEIKGGRKLSHWMWYIFPQIAGLGRTEISSYYAISSLEEAKAYMEEPILHANMMESADASRIFGFPDDMKLKSSMTLFAEACPQQDIFQKVLDKFFNGNKDPKTLELL